MNLQNNDDVLAGSNELLHSALESMFKSSDFQISELNIDPLDYAVMNPATHALFRVSGSVIVNQKQTPFSFVRKTMGLAPLQGAHPSFEMSNDRRHWNYWKREYLAYTCDWLPRNSTSIVMPQCFASACSDQQTAEIWLEDIDSEAASSWSIDRIALTAKHLGKWQGAFCANEFESPDWLSRNWVRELLKTRLKNEAELTADKNNWNAPIMRELFEPEIRDRVANIWNQRVTLLDLLDSLPQTVTHYDFRAPNLFAGKSDEETIAIDWQFVGEGPYGQDLVSLLIDNVFMNYFAPDSLESTESAVFESYIEGLESTGWCGRRNDVWLAYSATTAMRFGIACGWLVLLANNEDAARQQERVFNRPIAEILSDRLVAVRRSLELGEYVLANIR